MEKYIMTITPALKPVDRHDIQDALLLLGYHVSGGGTATDMTCCDVSFYKKEVKKMAKKPKLTRKDLEVLGWPSKSEKPIKKDKPVKKGHEWMPDKVKSPVVIKKKKK